MRESIERMAVELEIPLLFVDGHDNAIIGIARQFNRISVIYDKDKVVKNLCRDMSLEEAHEFFEFNIIGAWLGDHTPTFFELGFTED
jgi:hypothetical protein